MPEKNASVIATYSRRMRLRFDDGNEVEARIKGKRLKPVCGDRVVAAPLAEESDWLINAILERDNALTRPNLRGKTEVLAANIEFLIAVAAVSPKPDWYIIDRYLVAAEDMGVEAAVVYNKIDLALPDEHVTAALRDYEKAGYATLQCSAEAGSNLDALHALLVGKRAIVVGQSGVGKSSIINCLLGDVAQPTRTISDKTGEGKHTTVNSMMLTLPAGGYIIDSPGVRDFAPALQSATQVIHGFREIEKARHGCRFANCRHLREPDCAVKAAVEAGAISPRRYESYRRLLALTEKLDQQQ